MNFFDATILGIIEGLTEFLPVSSTGHMILVSELLKPENPEFVKTFEISIQLGAILAIVFLYSKQFLKNTLIYKKLAVAFIPTAIIGLFLYKIIKNYLFSPTVVAISLIIGGIILILLNKKIASAPSRHAELEKISYRNAFLIGLFQSISVIPGVSRAAATIIGGVFNGYNKKQATEFSFLLAVPTMAAAAGYNLLKTPAGLSGREFIILIFGAAISFIAAWVAVKIFLKIIDKWGFAFFGYYRIILGGVFIRYLML